MIEVIFPSAGHHDNDPGAVYNGVKEADKNKEFRDLLSKHLGSHKHIMDKNSETNAQHQKRIKPGSGSVLLDNHFNASANPSATGTEMIVANNASKLSIAMANELAEGTACILGIKNRGVKTEAQTARGKIGILNLGAGIAVLAELCFISNPNDMQRYESCKEELAKFFAQVLIKYDNMI